MNQVNWSASVPFPEDTNYVNRIMKATLEVAKSSGSPMVKVVFEVAQPNTMEGMMPDGSGVLVVVSGVETKLHFPIFVPGDPTKTKEARERFLKFLDGIDSIKDQVRDQSGEPDENGKLPCIIDWDNFPVDILKGKLVWCHMDAKVEIQRKLPTAEERAKAKEEGRQPVGAIMKNPRTGKDCIQYWPNIREVYGEFEGTLESAQG